MSASSLIAVVLRARVRCARWLIVAAVFLLCASRCGTAIADDTSAEVAAPPAAAKVESWIGADLTRRYGSIWTGLTWAPFQSLDAPGWRLRAVTGAGLYAYDGWAITDGVPAPARFHGRSLLGDALVGYQLQLGRLTLKPFAGIAIVQYAVSPVDPVSQTTGWTVGPKLSLESWLWLSDDLWVAADGSWTTVHDTTSVKARSGYRVWGNLSAGLEASLLTDVNQEMRRAGLHLRYSWERGEVSLGAGVTGASFVDAARSHAPYVSVTLLGKF